jgi:hypothetical protein
MYRLIESLLESKKESKKKIELVKSSILNEVIHQSSSKEIYNIASQEGVFGNCPSKQARKKPSIPRL